MNTSMVTFQIVQKTAAKLIIIFHICKIIFDFYSFILYFFECGRIWPITLHPTFLGCNILIISRFG